MSSAVKFGGEEHFCELESRFEGDHTRSEAKNVGIIVVASHRCGLRFVAESRADAAVLVRRDAHAYARAANENAESAFAAANELADLACVNGVVYGFGAVCAAIYAFISVFV